MLSLTREVVRSPGPAWDDDDLDLELDREPVCQPRADVCGGVTSFDGFDLGPVKKTVVGNGLDNVVERLVYGEGVEDATDKNLKGRLYQHFDQAGRMRVPFYDLHGQVGRSQRRLRTQYKAEASWPDSGGWNGQLEAEAFQTTYQYDALARVEQVNHPDGSKVRPRYHQSGRLRRVRVMAAGESTWSNYVVNIKYSAKSQRETILYGNGTRTDYRYDPATFRLEYLRTKRTGDDVTLQRITYVYDPVGNVVRITDDSHQRVLTNNQSVEPRQNYTYDALYRLVAATGREHPALNATSYKDPTGFKQSLFTLLNDSQQLSNYTRQYEYDAAGSLKTIVHVGHNSFTRELAVHDFSNRALLKTDTFDPDTSADWVAAGYFDANGNQTKFDHLVGATWNYRDNLGSVTLIERTSGNDDTEYYVYDAAGQRVRKVKETFGYGETVEYVSEKIYLGGVEIKRERSIDLSTMTVTPTLERADLHVMDDKQRIAIVNRWTNDATGGEAGSVVDPANPATYVSKQRYQYGNHLGSASLELDDSGLVISYEEYFPYGGTSIIAGNSQAEVKLKEYRYTGKERDDTSGFYYHGARYFAPWTGRWMSADPAGPVDGLNLYEYVSGNPVRMVDPEGMQGEVPIRLPETGSAEFEARLQSKIEETKSLGHYKKYQDPVPGTPAEKVTLKVVAVIYPEYGEEPAIAQLAVAAVILQQANVELEFTIVLPSQAEQAEDIGREGLLDLHQRKPTSESGKVLARAGGPPKQQEAVVAFVPGIKVSLFPVLGFTPEEAGLSAVSSQETRFDPTITAHEIMHQFRGPGHTGDDSHLMFAPDLKTGTHASEREYYLTTEEVAAVRSGVHWKPPPEGSGCICEAPGARVERQPSLVRRLLNLFMRSPSPSERQD
jgi:RHS repeat-associated protein